MTNSTALYAGGTAKALQRIAKGDLCAGCGACAAIAPDAIRMDYSKDGYLRPVQRGSVTAAQDDRIATVCPGLGETVEAGDRPDPVLWGPYRSMTVGHAADAKVRFAGSSGGVLSAIAAALIENGTVDAVVQIAPHPDIPTANLTVVSHTSAEIVAAAGSRYAPSAPVAEVAALAGTGRRHAFIGKPCDIVAMRGMIATDPALEQTFPVLLSFFCAGVPSLHGSDQVLQALGTSRDATQAFRYRGNGWPGRAVATDAEGRERAMSYHDSWGKILSRHVQHRCKICADGTGVLADIVCADAWECDDAGYPLFEEAEGESLIVARTDLGEDLVARIAGTGHIARAPFDPARLTLIQPGQRERRRALAARLAALRLCLRPVPDYRGLQILAAARQNPLSRNLRNFLGMLRRSLRPKRKTS